MKMIIFIAITSILLSSCASIVGGSETPDHLMTKKPFAEFRIEQDIDSSFNCLSRWVVAKN
jgi:uncharacterized protein YceK